MRWPYCGAAQAPSSAGATGLLATAKSPSARTDNWLYAYGEVAGTLALAGRLVRLGAAVIRGIRPKVEVLANGAGANFIGAADLAEDLSLANGLDYRTSYKIVGRAVADAAAAGHTRLSATAVSAIASDMTGKPVVVEPALIHASERPGTLVAARAAPGCAAPDRVREHAERVRAAVRQAAGWRTGRRGVIADAERELLAAATKIAAT